jgi:hypothetical protein
MTATPSESVETNDHFPSALLATPKGFPVTDTIAVLTLVSGLCDLRAGEHTGGVLGRAVISERAGAATPARTAALTAVRATKIGRRPAISCGEA